MLDKFLVYNIMNLNKAIKQQTTIKQKNTSVHNFHNTILKWLKLKRIRQVVFVDTLNYLKSSSLHIKSTFSQEWAPLKLNLKISMIACPHDALLNLKKRQ
jgi:hypothetical protein